MYNPFSRCVRKCTYAAVWGAEPVDQGLFNGPVLPIPASLRTLLQHESASAASAENARQVELTCVCAIVVVGCCLYTIAIYVVYHI
jgi:hypothetical protein